MYRKDLIPYLVGTRMTLKELAQTLTLPLHVVESDLQHLLKSLKHSDYKTVIEPAVCRKCGFTFRDGRLKKPGKCPEGRSTWIDAPIIYLEELNQ